MAIRFKCEHCGKTVEAPDAAAGKRGTCPRCKQSNFIPAPVAEDDVLEVQEIDTAEQARLEAERQRLRQKEQELLEDLGPGKPPVPLEEREDLKSDDLHHFVVNYCLDMAESNLARASKYAGQLKGFGAPGQQAVSDFLSGKVKEQALAQIPPRLLQGFLTQLRDEIR